MRYTNIKSISWILFTILLFGACGKQNQTASEKPTFLNTLNTHLNAIQTSNLTELAPTIADNVSMIAPDGKKFDTKKVFMEFHENWFAQTNWEWEGDILRTESSDSLGYALIQYHFTQKDSVGNILFRDHEYLILIFKNSTDGWQLVHDQNTGIQELNKQSN